MCFRIAAYAVSIMLLEQTSTIYGKLIGAWNHQNPTVRGKFSLAFQFFESLNQLGTDIHLLYFIPPQGTHDGEGFLIGSAEEPSLHLKRLPVGGLQREQNFFSHTLPPKTLAMRDPS